jgi:hypothetical protein
VTLPSYTCQFGFFKAGPINAIIRHLPGNTPAEIYEGQVELRFNIISLKQMFTDCRSQGSSSTSLPLFLTTLLRSVKSHEIFKLTSLCYISTKVEPYRSQNGLMQCHNCQQFSHISANYKQPTHCLLCGDGHLHRECHKRARKIQHRLATIVI